MRKRAKVIYSRRIYFVAGFVALQLVSSPKAFIGNLREWAKARHMLRFEAVLEVLWKRMPNHQLVDQGRYREYESVVRRKTLWGRFRHLFRLVGIKRETYFLQLKPQDEVAGLRTRATRPRSRQIAHREKKILLLATNSLPYTESGYTVRTHETAKALVKLGEEVQVVTRYGYPLTVGTVPSAETEVIDGVEYTNVIPLHFHWAPWKQTKFMVEKVATIAKRIDADVILATTDFHNALVAHRAAELVGIPWIYELRGKLEDTWLSKQPPEYRDLARKSDRYILAKTQESLYARAANAVVSLGAPLTEWLLKEGVNDDRIYEIPNAVPTEAFNQKVSRSSIRRKLGLPEGIFIGSVTSVVPYEGLDILLEIAHIDSKLNVLIVGDGVDLPRLRELADELSIADRVFLVGRQPSDSIWDWYAALDIFVLPRLDVEVCRAVTPLKPLGAMAVGTPVIASDLPAIRYITGNLATYIKGRDANDYVRAIEKILLHPPEPTSLIDWAREHTWDKNALVYLRMINELQMG